MKKPIVLSKSKYAAGLTCPKLLWLQINDPEKIPPFGEDELFRFEVGHEVGDLAKKLYPDGIEITREKATETTKELLKKRKPLFEATFLHKNSYCKVDLLIPHGKDEWVIIEVKSSTEVKDEHLDDVAFQYYCLTGCGMSIHKVYVMVLNNEYVLDGDVNLKELLSMHDVTEDAVTKSEDVEGNIENMVQLLNGKCPTPKYGSECKEPKACPVCAPTLEGIELAELYYFGKRAWPLINEGLTRFKDLPKDVNLGTKQITQIKSVETGEPQIQAATIRHFLNSLRHPLICMDFETANPGIPLFQGTKPYQQIPFQFSAHIIDGRKVKHSEFLADGSGDPRPDFVKELKRLPREGTVLAFNASFEKRILHDLAEAFPKEANWIHNMTDRMEDLATPFKEFWYYHPKQRGSYSIKRVLPAMTGKGYEGLTIAEGGAATRAFISLLRGKIKGKDLVKTRKDLLAYCGKDTEGMISILKQLQKITQNGTTRKKSKRM